MTLGEVDAMRGVRILPLVLLLACGGDEAGDAPADSLATGETTAQLLSPVRAVSMVEIEAGQSAAQRAERPEVRQYAATVATDYRALIAILDSVAAVQGTPLSETPDARDLASAVRTAHSTTENLTGFDFDATFVRAEVEAQRQLLDKVDQQLIPAALNPETQTLLRDIRALTDAHLTRARQLLAVLARAPDPEPAPVPVAPRPRPTTQTPPAFVPTVTDTVRPPLTTGPPVPPIPPITTSG